MVQKMERVAINKKFLKSFFHFKPNLYIIVITSIFFTGIYVWQLRINDLKIFPGNKTFKIDFFNDSVLGGNSQIEKCSISDTAISFTFVLKEGFINPYVGINIAPEKNSKIDISPFNQIQLELNGQNLSNWNIFIFTTNTNTSIDTSLKEICFWGNLEITSERNRYTLQLDQLKVPDWWYEANKLSPNKKLYPDWENVTRINFGNGSSVLSDINRSINIYSFLFNRNNKGWITLFVIAELFIILFLIVIQYIRNNTGKKTEYLTIAYKPVDSGTENRQQQSFLDYINSNFHDSNLNLENVSGNTGINQRRIANTIFKTFGCNFKTYVNQIRINESKRLLMESELNIGEISFKVGFNNQSHFNRVFKSIVGLSPSEFKETKK